VIVVHDNAQRTRSCHLGGFSRGYGRGRCLRLLIFLKLFSTSDTGPILIVALRCIRGGTFCTVLAEADEVEKSMCSIARWVMLHFACRRCQRSCDTTDLNLRSMEKMKLVFDKANICKPFRFLRAFVFWRRALASGIGTA
jgi:hypothetical protein